MSASPCELFRSVAAEVALGIAGGEERAAAIEHLQSCSTCRRELDRHTTTVDALLASAPPIEPPSGFEVRVLDACAAAGTAARTSDAAHRSRRRPAAWLAVAAALVLAGALVVSRFVGGVASTTTAAAGPSGVVQDPDGAPVGRVSVRPGGAADAPFAKGATLVVDLAGGAPNTTYRVQCDYESGRPYTAGTLRTGADGVRRWQATVEVPTYDLRRVRLVSTDGREPNLEAEIDS